MATPASLRALLSHADEYGAAVRNAMPKKVIVAYHGSPYDFDRFDASKIGTGEGAQSYGHGLYFAGREGTARSYRDRLSGQLLIDNAPLSGDASDYVRLFAEKMAAGKGASVARDIARLQRRAGQAKARLDDVQSRWDALGPEAAYEVEGLVSELAHAKVQSRHLEEQLNAFNTYLRDRAVRRNAGHMYEVEIGYPEESLLDWDAAFARQPPAVQSAFGDVYAGNSIPNVADGAGDGRKVYLELIARGQDAGLGGNAAAVGAARQMRDAGIPGIRYLDQGSRSAGEGTRNYVMFPGTEDRIRILRKYGLLAPMGAGMMGGEE